MRSTTVLDDMSELKSTSLGRGYFITWVTTYTDQNERVAGRQRFRIYKFAPGTAGAPGSGSRRSQAAAVAEAPKARPQRCRRSN